MCSKGAGKLVDWIERHYDARPGRALLTMGRLQWHRDLSVAPRLFVQKSPSLRPVEAQKVVQSSSEDLCDTDIPTRFG